MAYNNNPYGNARPNVAPLRPPQGYDQVAHPPPSPRLDSAYDNSDIQDDPYSQNPNLPPAGGRFYGAGMNNDYSRQSLAASEVSLHHPQGSQQNLGSPYADTPRGGYAESPNASFVKGYGGAGAYRDEPDSHEMAYRGDSRSYESPMPEKRDPYGSRDAAAAGGGGKSKRKLIIGILIAVLVIAIAGVCVYIFIIKPKSDDSKSTGTGKNSSSSSNYNFALTGADGSKVLKDDNTTFVYSNKLGGKWVYDPNNPYDDSAQAQSYTPALSKAWNWSDRIRGVNIGGWLVLEPFISPAMFEIYPNTSDEYHLSLAMKNDNNGAGFDKLREHYRTFITEEDFAEVAGAGLNWIRLPIAFWAIETYADEPYLAKESWQWVLKALAWARKYGLRVNFDLHAVPGSQNGWNHSGHLGDVNFMVGVMGIANAQRTLTYIRMLAQFISQPQYRNVVGMFGIINEAAVGQIGQPQIMSFYVHVYDMIRGITGVGKGPLISIHDGFLPFDRWTGFLTNADRVGWDTHFYFAFAKTPSNASLPTWSENVCTKQQPKMTAALKSLGHINAGEFSLAINDCGLNVNGVGLGQRYEGTLIGNDKPAAGNCSDWDIWENYTADTKAGLKDFALHEFDALYNYFFWTWKIGNTTQVNPPSVRAPFWSYKLGLEQGWMPTDPREADGKCSAANFDGVFSAWQTGGAGAGSTAATYTTQYPWPPVQISSTTYVDGATPTPASMLYATALPWYTPTGTVIVLPTPTFFGANKTVDGGNGIANPQAVESMYTIVAGCTYPEVYSGNTAAIPACGQPSAAAAKREVAARALITPAPSAL
ncbi:glycoside hydrolase [Auriculariales sp. MPI-PUGE-AT-0066]|nr:glycoside hydrolase [Auriculariales sp. MPI-PUGE-AT-0066]